MPSLTTFKLLKQEHNARRGEFKTVHGTVQTPAFQNVATAGAIKGGLSAQDLQQIGTQVMLCNTYHLHLRPGDQLVADMGGLHKFTRWNGPILTDSGGFQVFSLSKLRKITEEGVTFASHLDGHRIFMGPEESMQIQANLGSTIAMAFDECVENPAQHAYSKASCERTTRWLKRCKAEMARLKQEGKATNPDQLLFGINQGCTFADLRVEHMKQIAELELDGYAIGGLEVQQGFQASLRHFGLVGRIGGVPNGVLEHVALDYGRRHGVVPPHADVSGVEFVFGCQRRDVLSELVFGHGFGQCQRFFEADIRGDGFINQLVQAAHSDFAEHLLFVLFADADVAVSQ